MVATLTSADISVLRHLFHTQLFAITNNKARIATTCNNCNCIKTAGRFYKLAYSN